MDSENAFGRWLEKIIESTGLKKKVIAERADIKPGSLSRILSGETGVAKNTARNLINAINKLVGYDVADLETGLRLAVGLPKENHGLPDKIQDIDYTGLNDDDLEDIAEFVRFKRMKKGLPITVPPQNDIIEFNNPEMFSILESVDDPISGTAQGLSFGKQPEKSSSGKIILLSRADFEAKWRDIKKGSVFNFDALTDRAPEMPVAILDTDGTTYLLKAEKIVPQIPKEEKLNFSGKAKAPDLSREEALEKEIDEAIEKQKKNKFAK